MTYHDTTAFLGFTSEMKKICTRCTRLLYPNDGIYRMWDGGVALAKKISEILPCNDAHFFSPRVSTSYSCFLLWSYLCCQACGFGDFHYFLFIFVHLIAVAFSFQSNLNEQTIPSCTHDYTSVAIVLWRFYTRIWIANLGRASATTN